MLDTATKKKIDDARDILVGKVPVPSTQVEQITIALIYKFMYDMDNESIELGGNPKYFTGDFAQYAWNRLFDPKLSGEGRVNLYQDALARIPANASIPTLFRDIFKNAFLPYRDPETLRLFLKTIDEFTYEHSEKLGDAFEYLLAVLGSQGDAGQFRTPRHIIDFMVELIDPQKEDSILDPACGTAGFLISAYKHIIKTNSSNYDPVKDPHTFDNHGTPLDELISQNGKKYTGDLLTPDQRAYLHNNIKGYDIAFEMVRLSLVNMYLHGFNTPQIYEYDTLTSTQRWNEYANVILANPPFMTPKGGIRPHQKFSIQAKRSEVLFVDYMLEHLTSNGRAGIIVPEGIIFQNGKAYKELRRLMVEENYLVGVISLPPGVFNPYSGVKTSILWIDKKLAQKTDKIIFLKINNDGFDLGAQRRPIAANDLPAAFANAMAYKKALLSGEEYNVPEKDVILAEKAMLAEKKDFNLDGERYRPALKSLSHYPVTALGEFCIIGSGNSAPQEATKFVNGKYPFFRTADVGKLHLSDNLISSTDYLNDDGIKDMRLFTKGTILFPKSGASTLLNHRALLGVDGYVSSHLATIKPDPTKAIPKFIYYLLMVFDAREITYNPSYPSVKISEIAKIKVPLPPLSVQEEIVAELDSYQKIIDGAKQVVDNWKPRIDIDPEWEQYEIQKIAVINPLKKEVSNLSSELPVSFVPMSDLLTNRMTFTPLVSRPIGELLSGSYTYFKNNDILLAKVTPCFENGKAGIALDLLNGIGFGSSEYYVFRCTDKILPQWIYILLVSPYFRIPAIANMTGTGGLQRIPKSFINTFRIPVPDLSIQQAIIDRIENEQKLIDTNRQLITLYEQKIKDRVNKLWEGSS
ncbi:MAG: N-6 DNA methylase [Candidatus Cloacimonetes bacterium]|nr:N-6 DNA methylase [Candidatus Cloacimonadota bacterium]